MQGRSIGRILYTRALSQTRAGNHSSRHVVTHMLKPPTRILGRTTLSGRSRTYAYLVLLRMEVAAFHPASPHRFHDAQHGVAVPVRVLRPARDAVSSLWPYSSASPTGLRPSDSPGGR